MSIPGIRTVMNNQLAILKDKVGKSFAEYEDEIWTGVFYPEGRIPHSYPKP